MKPVISHLSYVPNSIRGSALLAGHASTTANVCETWNISFVYEGGRVAAHAEYVGDVRGEFPEAHYREFRPTLWFGFEMPAQGCYLRPDLRIDRDAISYSQLWPVDYDYGAVVSAEDIFASAVVLAAVAANHTAHDANVRGHFRGEFSAAMTELARVSDAICRHAATPVERDGYDDLMRHVRALARAHVIEERWHSMYGSYNVYGIDGFEIPSVPAAWRSPFQVELKRHLPTSLWDLADHI